MTIKKDFLPKAAYFALEAALEKLLSQLTPYELPQDAQLTGETNEHIIYIESAQMPLFEKFVGKLKRYKFINYGRPACALHYTTKHKYFLNKKPLQEQVKLLLIDSISELVEAYQECEEQVAVATEPAIEQLIKAKMQEIQSKKEMYQTIFAQIDSHDFALSNYYRGYAYTTLNYKYYNSKDSCFESVSEHIVKDIYSREELVLEKYNIIFIDTERISKKIPYQSKEVESYLSQFDTVVARNLQDLYIRKR